MNRSQVKNTESKEILDGYKNWLSSWKKVSNVFYKKKKLLSKRIDSWMFSEKSETELFKILKNLWKSSRINDRGFGMMFIHLKDGRTEWVSKFWSSLSYLKDY